MHEPFKGLILRHDRRTGVGAASARDQHSAALFKLHNIIVAFLLREITCFEKFLMMNASMGLAIRPQDPPLEQTHDARSRPVRIMVQLERCRVLIQMRKLAE
jgi:hypothetical protein